MSEIQDLTDRVRDTVARGATAAEEIHREVANLPLTLLETLGVDEQTTDSIRRIQSESITAVYDVVRNVNHRVAGFSREFAEGFESEPRRPAAS